MEEENQIPDEVKTSYCILFVLSMYLSDQQKYKFLLRTVFPSWHPEFTKFLLKIGWKTYLLIWDRRFSIFHEIID